jgi:hypothetical protein
VVGKERRELVRQVRMAIQQFLSTRGPARFGSRQILGDDLLQTIMPRRIRDC